MAPETAITLDLVRSLYHPEDADALVAAFDTARRNGSIPEMRLRIVRPDGRVAHIMFSAERESDEILVGIVRDITDESDAERALIMARDHAKAADRGKAEMLAVMSHEIRTPMNGLLGTIDSLRRSTDETQRRALIEQLGQAASTVMTVVDDMLEHSRVEAGRLVIESINFDLKATIRTTLDLFSGSATAKGLDLEAQGLDGDPTVVRGDSARLQQLLSNLIGNSIKHTEAGGISLSLSPTRSDAEADYWMIIIRDTGRGIGQDTLGRIFQRGEQMDAARVRLQGGTGLGLAISQQLAEAMGGSIAVSSDPGKGTIFSIELPFRHDRGAAAEDMAPVDTGPLSILLAEDNPINRRLMAGLLTREGHQVIAVEDGRKALAAIAGQSFDLVLMDMQMPEMDGISATRAIRALDPPDSDTPILAISADSQPDRRRLYFEAGIDNFLPKPIVSAQLLEMIGKMRRARRVSTVPAGDHFNRERLNLLVEQAGQEDAAVLVRMLMADVSGRPQRIAAAIRGQAWELAAAEAEALRALLDSFGSFGLSRLLGGIARQCARRECPPALIDELFAQAQALSTLLQQEFGGQAPSNVVTPEFGRG